MHLTKTIWRDRVILFDERLCKLHQMLLLVPWSLQRSFGGAADIDGKENLPVILLRLWHM